LRSLCSLANKEADAESAADCEEDNDDVKFHKGYSGEIYQCCELVDRRGTHRHESDPQCPHNVRVFGHKMSKIHPLALYDTLKVHEVIGITINITEVTACEPKWDARRRSLHNDLGGVGVLADVPKARQAVSVRRVLSSASSNGGTEAQLIGTKTSNH
jgi:hypothetical protein